MCDHGGREHPIIPVVLENVCVNAIFCNGFHQWRLRKCEELTLAEPAHCSHTEEDWFYKQCIFNMFPFCHITDDEVVIYLSMGINENTASCVRSNHRHIKIDCSRGLCSQRISVIGSHDSHSGRNNKKRRQLTCSVGESSIKYAEIVFGYRLPGAGHTDTSC